MTSGTTSWAIARWSKLFSVDSAITVTRSASMDHRYAILKAKTLEKSVVDMSPTKNDYIRQVLDAYRCMPGATGVIRRNDRLLAATLHDRGIPLVTVENAILLAAARRIFRPPDAPALQPVRSLH